MAEIGYLKRNQNEFYNKYLVKVKGESNVKLTAAR